jgi:uncharacterized membrane protein
MKFPSLSNVSSEAVRTFRRFPLSIIAGLIGTMIAIYLVELELFEEQLMLVNLLLTLALGIPLFFCIQVLSEIRQLPTRTHTLIQLGGILFLGVIYWSFPAEFSFDTNRIPYIRYLVYNLTIHLFVAILPFSKSKNQLSFWNYNKLLFLRLILGALYSAVIFLGITFALLAIMSLFDIEINPKTFAQLFFFTVGVFNTWFFLAGVPLEFEQEFTSEDYPRGIRVFTQFVLIPLLLCYLLILYVYGGKIILTWDWPRGIVSYMIIAISVLGIFTNLLLFPYQEFKESGWIKLFYKAFYVLLFPLIILLFLAIGIRIEDYGLTVNRYIITLLGIWLSFIAIYFTFGKKDIKVIPISLAIFMIFSSFGPWGMFSLSKLIQVNRLILVLEENGLLVDGKILKETQWQVTEKGAIKAKKETPNINLGNNSLKEVNSIIQYLGDYHGLQDLEPWFDQDLKSVMATSAINSKANDPSMDWDELVIETMGLKFVSSYALDELDGSVKDLNFQASGDFSYSISGFEQLLKFETDKYKKGIEGDENYHVRLDLDNESVFLIQNHEKQIPIDLKDFIKELQLTHRDYYNTVDWDELRFEFVSEELEFILFFEYINARITDEELTLVSLKGFILIREVEKP